MHPINAKYLKLIISPNLPPGRQAIGGTPSFCVMFCCLLLTLYSTNSRAADNQHTAYPDYGIDFALELSRLEMDLEANNITYPANQKRISVHVFDTTNTNVTYGFLAGSSYLSLDNDPATTGLQPDGFHFGLAIRTDVFEDPRLRLEGQYLYQELQDKTSTDTVTMDWYEWQINSSIRFGLSPRWGIILGGGYSNVDADRRVSGSSPQTLHLSLDTAAQGTLEFEMLFPGEGRASLTIVRGNQDGIKLNFARRF